MPVTQKRGIPQPDEESLWVRQLGTHVIHGGILTRDDAVERADFSSKEGNLPTPSVPQNIAIDPVLSGYTTMMQTQMAVSLAQPLIKSPCCFSGNQSGLPVYWAQIGYYERGGFTPYYPDDSPSGYPGDDPLWSGGYGS